MRRLVLVTIFIIFLAIPAYASAENFFVDSFYDWQGASSRSATLRHEGAHAYWYVSDQYWSGLTSGKRGDLNRDIIDLSKEFDSVIYPKLRDVFGSESKPGVDGDPKIKILLTRMNEDAGGYIREQDAFPREKLSISNETELININALHVGNGRVKSFLAHEFQHLITLNQKILERSVAEETWMNEMRSEIAPTLLGYDNPDVYLNSNLKARVEAFLKEPSDAMLDWENESKDYASVNLFGQYLLDHYGRSVFAAMMQTDKVGIESFNAALDFFGFKEDFNDAYTNWTIAALVNNCSLKPIDIYCYKNPSLQNFRVQFGIPESRGDTITSQNMVKDWYADWNKYEISLNLERPDKDIFRLDFSSPETSNFKVPYVVYDVDDLVIDIGEMDLGGGKGVLFVEDFGFRVPKIVVILSNQSQIKGTRGDAPSVSFSMTATTIEEIPQEISVSEEPLSSVDSPGSSAELPDIEDGSLIRAEGNYKVYVIKDGYKRWIQSAEIFDFYGHFNFASVQVISKEELALYKEAWLVRAAGDTKVYEINGDGTRHWLDMTPEKFTATGRTWDMVYIVDKAEIEWYKEGASVK